MYLSDLNLSSKKELIPANFSQNSKLSYSKSVEDSLAAEDRGFLSKEGKNISENTASFYEHFLSSTMNTKKKGAMLSSLPFLKDRSEGEFTKEREYNRYLKEMRTKSSLSFDSHSLFENFNISTKLDFLNPNKQVSHLDIWQTKSHGAGVDEKYSFKKVEDSPVSTKEFSHYSKEELKFETYKREENSESALKAEEISSNERGKVDSKEAGEEEISNSSTSKEKDSTTKENGNGNSDKNSKENLTKDEMHRAKISQINKPLIEKEIDFDTNKEQGRKFEKITAESTLKPREEHSEKYLQEEKQEGKLKSSILSGASTSSSGENKSSDFSFFDRGSEKGNEKRRNFSKNKKVIPSGSKITGNSTLSNSLSGTDLRNQSVKSSPSVPKEFASTQIKNEIKNSYLKTFKNAFIKLDSQGLATASIQMKPALLGRLSVHLQVQNKEVAAKVIIENQALKSIILEEFDGLRQELQKQGIHIENLTIKTREEDSLLDLIEGEAKENEQNTSFLAENKGAEKDFQKEVFRKGALEDERIDKIVTEEDTDYLDSFAREKFKLSEENRIEDRIEDTRSFYYEEDLYSTRSPYRLSINI